MVSSTYLMSRLSKQAAAWRKLAANDEFAGMKLADFEALISGIEEAKTDSIEFLTQLRAAVKSRREAEGEAMRMSKRLAMAIKSHPKHGEDSPLIRAIGFVAESERRSGKTNKGQRTTSDINQPAS